MNKLGVFCWEGLSFLFGTGKYALPFILTLIGFWVVRRRQIKHPGWRSGGAILFLAVFCALAEMFLNNGGAIGNLFVAGLQKIFGLMNAYFCSLFLLGLSLLLMFNCTLKNFVLFLYKTFVGSPSRPAAPAPRRRPRPAAPPPPPPRHPIASPRIPQPAPPPPVRRPTAAPAPNAPAYISNADNYKFPPLKLLRPPVDPRSNQRQQEAQFYQDKQLLENTLASFNVKARVTNVCQGPSVTRYELTPMPGVRVNKIASLADDISLTMATTVRIEAPVPGKSVVGIEVPNQTARPVNLSELAEQPEFNRHPLTAALGLDIAGSPVFCHLQEMPHLLIAGATGSGKSVCVNSLIMSILLKAAPQDVRFVMIDPKRVELSNYNSIPHLVAPVVHEPNLAHLILKFWAVKEMEKRYEIFTKAGVKNIESFNKLAARHSGKVLSITQETAEGVQSIPYRIAHLPYVVIIIDELADLMMVGSKEVEGSICRIAQMARAVGMHLVIATQRPSVDVITGLIKANVPSRVAFAVGSQIDSRTIIDGMGAEKLLGKGDMLYSPVGARHVRRVQGVLVSDDEIQRVADWARRQAPAAYEIDLGKLRQQAEQNLDGKNNSTSERSGGGGNVRQDGRDVLFDQATQLVQSTGKKSISYIQRRFRIGYNRAARIVEELDEAGILTNS
ncbi:cell division protein FtsK [Candidatus Termititenax persephonae]|uniref:Cell division protein FtsK n=1 Tax=Candidatus Termititenax persephonae TaxID=2218525 RepID=A0A388TFE3_9BACT|nr:cell division protein FtsK [Candidatus Termititenax persephonae]